MQQHFSMAKEQGRQRVWETEKRRRTIFCSNSFRFAINVRLFTADEQTVNRWKTPATNPIFRPYFSNSLFFSSVLWLFLSNAASSSASHNIFANVIVRFQCYLLGILSKKNPVGRTWYWLAFDMTQYIAAVTWKYVFTLVNAHSHLFSLTDENTHSIFPNSRNGDAFAWREL